MDVEKGMVADFSDWMPGSPFRRPEWRWLRANFLLQKRRRLNWRIDDDGVFNARQFLRATGGNQTGQGRLSPMNVTIQSALDIFQEQPPSRRWELEALLLTDLPMNLIADRLGLATETIEVFHHLFFEVRPRLIHRDWVMMQVVGTHYWAGFSGMPIEAVWKWVAFSAGAVALDIVIAATNNQPFPEYITAGFTGNPVVEEARLRLKIRILIAVMMASDDESVDELVAMGNVVFDSQDRDDQTWSMLGAGQPTAASKRPRPSKQRSMELLRRRFLRMTQKPARRDQASCEGEPAVPTDSETPTAHSSALSEQVAALVAMAGGSGQSHRPELGGK
jgi:hypothetical protein